MSRRRVAARKLRPKRPFEPARWFLLLARYLGRLPKQRWRPSQPASGRRGRGRGVSASSDHGNLAPSPGHSWRRRGGGFSVVRQGLTLVLSLGLLLLLIQGLRLAARHPYFAVSDIAVRGARQAEVGAVLALSGIREGESVWGVSPSVVADRLETHPWIRQALVTRRLPRKVIIEVIEWKPRAIVKLDDFYYVDPRGNVFARVGTGTEYDLPFITGLSPLLKRGEAGFAGSALREALALLVRIEEAGVDLVVSELHIDRQAGIDVFLNDPALAVGFGWGGWATKVGYLKAVLARWQGHRGRLARIGLSYRGQAVVRLRGGRG